MNINEIRERAERVLRCYDNGGAHLDEEDALVREDVPWLLAELERVTAERDEALGLLDNERLYTAEHRGYALLAKDDLAAAEAERDRLREALERIQEELSEWRHGSDWSGEGSGQMPDRVLILRLEELVAELAGGTDATPPQDKAPKDTALAGDARYRGAPQRKPGVREQESPDAAPLEQKP